MSNKKDTQNKAFAELIRRMGYNQKQFAEALGVTPPTLNCWLWNKYKPTPYHLAKMVREFGIEFDELNDIFYGGDTK